VDKVFEPLMAAQPAGSPLVSIFGETKGAGAAMLFSSQNMCGAVPIPTHTTDCSRAFP